MRTSGDNLWLDMPYEANRPLAGFVEADVGIVGGGFTGLAAAYFIKQRFSEKKIVVLESDYIGYGSSGRNLGLASSLLGHNVLPIMKSQGPERTRRYHQLGIESISLVEELVREHNIDCEYASTGRLDIAQTDREIRLLEKKAKAYEAIGAEFEWLDKARVSSRFEGTKALTGLYSPDDGTFHPGKFIRGLKNVVESAGADICENSRCMRIETGPMISLYTSLGRLRVKDVVLATNAYTDPLGLFRNRVIPLYVYNTATEPLTDSQLDAFGWPKREPVKNQKYLFWTLRLTPENRIVFNDANALCFYNNERDYSHSPKVYRKQRNFLRSEFPMLRDVKITHQWGGRVGITLDFLPSVGCRGESRNIYYSMGYNGHGVAFACLAGKMLAQLMAGETSPLTSHPLINKRLWGVPSSAITYLATNAYEWYFKIYDLWLGMGK